MDHLRQKICAPHIGLWIYVNFFQLLFNIRLQPILMVLTLFMYQYLKQKNNSYEKILMIMLSGFLTILLTAQTLTITFSATNSNNNNYGNAANRNRNHLSTYKLTPFNFLQSI